MCNSMPIRNDFSSVNVHITQLNYAAAPRTHMHSSGEFFSISKSNVHKGYLPNNCNQCCSSQEYSGMYTLAAYTYNTNQRRTATKLQQTRKGNSLLRAERKIIIYIDLSVHCERGFVIRPTAGSPYTSAILHVMS